MDLKITIGTHSGYFKVTPDYHIEFTPEGPSGVRLTIQGQSQFYPDMGPLEVGPLEPGNFILDPEDQILTERSFVF